MSLAAIPLLFEGQRPVTRQVYAAMGATNHWGGVLLRGGTRRAGAGFHPAKDPYGGGNDSEQDQ